MKYSENVSMDFLSVLASVTASPWFMVSMGIWLGTLVIFRLIEVNSLENKIRYILIMFSYVVYSVWLPSFSPISKYSIYVV